jgi:cytochrome P450
VSPCTATHSLKETAKGETFKMSNIVKELLTRLEMLEPFGPNVVSVEGDAWRKHIRITVPPFGEAVNKLVWEETFRQTNMLASSWANSGSGDLKRDIYSLTVNIMSCVGFGKPAEWTDDMNATPAGHSITLVSAIMGVVTNLAPLLLLPKWVLKHSSLSHVYEAYVEFEKYMNEYLNEEKQKIAMNQNYESNVKGNLLTAVLKSSTSGMTEKDPGKPSEKLSFTDEEVRGNVFMFLLAGMLLDPSFHQPLRINRQKLKATTRRQTLCYSLQSFSLSIKIFKTKLFKKSTACTKRPQKKAEPNYHSSTTFQNFDIS